MISQARLQGHEVELFRISGGSWCSWAPQFVGCDVKDSDIMSVLLTISQELPTPFVESRELLPSPGTGCRISHERNGHKSLAMPWSVVRPAFMVTSGRGKSEMIMGGRPELSIWATRVKRYCNKPGIDKHFKPQTQT